MSVEFKFFTFSYYLYRAFSYFQHLIKYNKVQIVMVYIYWIFLLHDFSLHWWFVYSLIFMLPFHIWTKYYSKLHKLCTISLWCVTCSVTPLDNLVFITSICNTIAVIIHICDMKFISIYTWLWSFTCVEFRNHGEYLPHL